MRCHELFFDELVTIEIENHDYYYNRQIMHLFHCENYKRFQ